MGERIAIELGHHSINIILKDKHVNIKIYPTSLRHRALREFEVLRKLREHGINVPEPMMLMDSNNCVILVREYIEGIFFRDAMYVLEPDKLKALLIKLIKQLNGIENLGIYIPEFSTLSKNVVVVDTEPFIIDVERALFLKRPIVTQLLGLLIKLSTNKQLYGKLAKIIKIDELREVARAYKKSREIDVVLQIFRD